MAEDSSEQIRSLTRHSDEGRGVLPGISTAIDRAPRQAKCAKCVKTVRPGGGIVLEFGAGGRVHRECFTSR